MIFRTVAGAFSLLFALAVAVQLNDPDPLLWIVVYLAAAGLSVAAALGRSLPRISAGVLFGYLAMGAFWLPALEYTSLQAFGSIGMSSVQDEEVRELWGLAICIAWSAAVLLHGIRAVRQSDPRRTAES